MPSPLLERALLVVLAIVTAAAACSGGGPSATGGGSSSSGALTSSSSSSSGSMPACTGGTADGTCDTQELIIKACTCPDCATTALCHPGQCKMDGACTLADECTCSECRGDPSCACNHDGACEVFTEDCGCLDCAEAPSCKGQPLAVLCPDTMTCTSADGCTCAPCQNGQGGQGGGGDAVFCTDPARCVDDGKCTFDEGCQCADCKATSECATGAGGGPADAGAG